MNWPSVWKRIRNIKKVFSCIIRFLDIDPFSFTAWYNLGIIYNQIDKYEKAIEAYDYALLLNESFHSAIFNKANSYANSGKFLEAIEFYKEYLEHETDSEETLLYIAEKSSSS